MFEISANQSILLALAAMLNIQLERKTLIRKEEMIMGHCGPIITTFNGPFQCSLCKN
jgi:hypothetical protein